MNATAIPIGPDTTERLSCRSGDMLIWFRWGNPFMGGEMRIADMWTMQDGDQLILTNRLADIPPWFALHGSEVRSASQAALERFLAANRMPDEPMDGPTVWRLLPGDLLAWTGDPRPGIEGEQGVLRIYRFTEESLVLGEARAPRPFGIMFDPAVRSDPLQVKRGQRAAYMVRQMGYPNVIAADDDWKLSI